MGRAINNNGQVIGQNITSDFYLDDPFIWTANGGMQALPGWEAFSINNAGQVLLMEGPGACCSATYIWTADKGIQDSPPLDGTDINDSGQVVGNSVWAPPFYGALKPVYSFFHSRMTNIALPALSTTPAKWLALVHGSTTTRVQPSCGVPSQACMI